MEKRNLDRLATTDTFGSEPVWYVAEEYAINHDEIVVVEWGDAVPYLPLHDPNLFSSFSRLGSSPNPSERTILNWVRKYGLFRRKLNSQRPYNWSEAEQQSVTVEDFVKEIREARSASLLHYELNRGTPESLKRYLRLLHDASRERPLVPLEEKLVSTWGDTMDNPGFDPRRDPNHFLLTQIGFKGFVERKLSEVKLALLLREEHSNLYMSDATPAYTPLQSWSCPDLISAIYLHFYLMVTGAVPMELCANKNCRTPFPVTRSNKKVCSAGCRSSTRPSRQR